jgi:hypothetical protein
MSEGVYVLHRFYTKQQAIDKVRKILDEWERKGYRKTDDVPPSDKNIVEYLQLMKGLGYPIVGYRQREKLKEVI